MSPYFKTVTWTYQVGPDVYDLEEYPQNLLGKPNDLLNLAQFEMYIVDPQAHYKRLKIPGEYSG